MSTKAWPVLVLFLCPLQLVSQKVVTTEGYAQIELTETISRAEAKNQVKEKAKINAIERAFGTVIVQGNSTYITNVQTGQKVETNTVFNTIANTSVKGEVIQILEEKYTDVTGTKIIDGKKEPVTEIRCDIRIKAKEITTPPANFVSFPLACTNVRCQTTSFRDKDSLYLYFSSPVSGYLSVFLDDNTATSCLYPYSKMPVEFEGGVPVKADQKYILFSDKSEFNYFPGKYIVVDQYMLSAEKAQEMNRLFIVFSKSPVNKPSLTDVKTLQDKYSLPKALNSEDFQRWLNSYRSQEKAGVEVAIINITITK
jgi:hypothetical protein